MLASVPIAEARRILLDAGVTAYSADDLFGFLREALRATANVKKDFYVVTGPIELVPGDLQELPDGGVNLIKIVRNASGAACTQCDLGLLQEANRAWSAEDPTDDAENWAFDPRDPTRFWLTPPSIGGSGIGLVGSYGAVPEVADADSEIPVGDENQALLVNFILARSYSISSKRYDPNKEQFYFGQWGSMVGLKSQAQIAASPKTSESPGA
jgi:hypothetical protein